MSALQLHLPAALRSRVEARAAEDGFETVEAYVEALLLADAAGGPAATDEQLEALLLGRLEGPFVDVNAADFRQMREKLRARLDAGTEGDAGRPGPRP
jgi:hypothetical protein